MFIVASVNRIITVSVAVLCQNYNFSMLHGIHCHWAIEVFGIGLRAATVQVNDQNEKARHSKRSTVATVGLGKVETYKVVINDAKYFNFEAAQTIDKFNVTFYGNAVENLFCDWIY